MRAIVVEPYNPGWPQDFQLLCDILLPYTMPWSSVIEHVGSTSVPGLAAKPIIDIDIVVPDWGRTTPVIEVLKPLGYTHAGNQGIEGREVLTPADETVPYTRIPSIKPKHHLYIVLADCAALENHRRLRTHLRTHPKAAREYSQLKLELAARYPNDTDSYIAGKTELITRLLLETGMDRDAVAGIRAANSRGV